MEDLKEIIPEQTWNDLMTEVALENALTGNSYSSSSAAPPSTNQGISVKQRLVDPILEGASFVSKTKGARVEMLRDSNIGMRVLNENSSEIFKILVGGTDVGDIIIGDYDGGQGAKWDDSMGTFDVLGTIQATIGKIGGFAIGADYIRDTADTFGLASTTTSGDDIRIWGGASFDNRASANFYITESGQALFKYVTISGGSNVKFISDTIDTENKNILKDFTFSPSDYSGAFKSGDITWDTSTGLVTGGTGIVMHKGGIVGAKDGNATFSINASTGDATFAGTLSAAGGSLGEITTGQITLDTTGYVRGGMTDYMTGIGVFLGYSGDAYKFSVGDPSGDYFNFNGVNIDYSGSLSYKVNCLYGEAMEQQTIVGLYKDYYTGDKSVKSIYKKDYNAYGIYAYQNGTYRNFSITGDDGDLYVFTMYKYVTGTTEIKIEISKQDAANAVLVSSITSKYCTLINISSTSPIAYDTANNKIIVCTGTKYQIFYFHNGLISPHTSVMSFPNIPANYSLADVAYDPNENCFVVFFSRFIDNYTLYYYIVQCNPGTDTTSTVSAGDVVPISDVDNKLRGVFANATINPATGYIYFLTSSSTADYNRIYQVRVKSDKTLEKIGTRYSTNKAYSKYFCYDETAGCLVAAEGDSNNRYVYAYLVSINGTSLSAGNATTIYDSGASNSIYTSKIVYNPYLKYCCIVSEGSSSTPTVASHIIINNGVISSFENNKLFIGYSQYGSSLSSPWYTKTSFNIVKTNGYSGVSTSVYEIVPCAYGKTYIMPPQTDTIVSTYWNFTVESTGLNRTTIIKLNTEDIYIATYRQSTDIRAVAFKKGGNANGTTLVGTRLIINNTNSNGNVRCCKCGQANRFVAVYHYKVTSETGELRIVLCEVNPVDLSISIIQERTLRSSLITARSIIAFYNHFNNVINVGHQYSRRQGGVETHYWETYEIVADGDETITIRSKEEGTSTHSYLVNGGLSLYSKLPYWITTNNSSPYTTSIFIGGKTISISNTEAQANMFYAIWSDKNKMLILPTSINTITNTYKFDNLKRLYDNTDISIGRIGDFGFIDENEDKILFTAAGTTWAAGIFKIDTKSNKFVADRLVDGCIQYDWNGAWQSSLWTYYCINDDGTYDILAGSGTSPHVVYIVKRGITLNSPSNYIGITYESGDKGDIKLVDYPNSVANYDGLTAGNFYYLGTHGLTTTPTDYKAGYAKTSNKMVIIK